MREVLLVDSSDWSWMSFCRTRCLPSEFSLIKVSRGRLQEQDASSLGVNFQPSSSFLYVKPGVATTVKGKVFQGMVPGVCADWCHLRRCWCHGRRSERWRHGAGRSRAGSSVGRVSSAGADCGGPCWRSWCLSQNWRVTQSPSDFWFLFSSGCFVHQYHKTVTIWGGAKKPPESTFSVRGSVVIEAVLAPHVGGLFFLP